MLFGSSMDAGSIHDPSLELMGFSSEDTARSKFLQFGGSKREQIFHDECPSRSSGLHNTWYRVVPRGAVS